MCVWQLIHSMQHNKRFPMSQSNFHCSDLKSKQKILPRLEVFITSLNDFNEDLLNKMCWFCWQSQHFSGCFFFMYKKVKVFRCQIAWKQIRKTNWKGWSCLPKTIDFWIFKWLYRAVFYVFLRNTMAWIFTFVFM